MCGSVGGRRSVSPLSGGGACRRPATGDPGRPFAPLLSTCPPPPLLSLDLSACSGSQTVALQTARVLLHLPIGKPLNNTTDGRPTLSRPATAAERLDLKKKCGRRSSCCSRGSPWPPRSRRPRRPSAAATSRAPATSARRGRRVFLRATRARGPPLVPPLVPPSPFLAQSARAASSSQLPLLSHGTTCPQTSPQPHNTKRTTGVLPGPRG